MAVAPISVLADEEKVDIAVVSISAADSNNVRYIKGLEDGAEQYGYEVSVLDADGSTDKANSAFANFVSRGATAIVNVARAVSIAICFFIILSFLYSFIFIQDLHLKVCTVIDLVGGKLNRIIIGHETDNWDIYPSKKCEDGLYMAEIALAEGETSKL